MCATACNTDADCGGDCLTCGVSADGNGRTCVPSQHNGTCLSSCGSDSDCGKGDCSTWCVRPACDV